MSNINSCNTNDSGREDIQKKQGNKQTKIVQTRIGKSMQEADSKWPRAGGRGIGKLIIHNKYRFLFQE
jgi:hypothetical protein